MKEYLFFFLFINLLYLFCSNLINFNYIFYINNNNISVFIYFKEVKVSFFLNTIYKSDFFSIDYLIITFFINYINYSFLYYFSCSSLIGLTGLLNPRSVIKHTLLLENFTGKSQNSGLDALDLSWHLALVVSRFYSKVIC